jgi:hypothetical protein
MKLICLLILIMTTSCSELLLLSSIGGAAVSQSPAIKAYNGIDALTIMKTKKDIKKHIYEGVKNETKKSKPNE